MYGATTDGVSLAPGVLRFVMVWAVFSPPGRGVVGEPSVSGVFFQYATIYPAPAHPCTPRPYFSRFLHRCKCRHCCNKVARIPSLTTAVERLLEDKGRANDALGEEGRKAEEQQRRSKAWGEQVDNLSLQARG